MGIRLMAWRGNPAIVLATVSLGFFMTLLDLTIVNIAIPDMITQLHASFSDILWIINAYTLALAALLVTSARLGDIVGQRQVFTVGAALFTIASVACGLVPSAGWLITFRATQGVGAAILMPQTLTILTMIFPADRRGAAFGIWGGVAGLATVAGPTLGGLLVTALGWRYIFFVNLPVGLVVVALSAAFIPELQSGRQHVLDLSGVVLGSAGLLVLCYGLIEGQRYDWGTISSFISIPLVLGIGVLLLVAFLLTEVRGRKREPLIPLSILADRNFSLISLVSACAPIGIVGVLLPFTIYLQSVLGFSAVKAGLTMAPAPLVSIFVAPVAGRFSDRATGKYIILAGLVFFAAGIGIVAAVARTADSPYHFLPGLLVVGVGIGCTFAPMITVAMRDVDTDLAGAASGVFNTMRQVGTVVGTAGVGALLANRLTAAWTGESARWAPGTPAALRHLIVRRLVHAANGGLDLAPARAGNRLSAEIFSGGFVSAMRPTMIGAAGMLLVGAVIVLGIAEPSRQPPR
jgi:EmrB/QacA subfamily drug resistance transporter